MKLAILGTRGIPAQYGGFETFAEEISVRLVEKGINVTVFCEETNLKNKLMTYKGVSLEYVSLPNFLGPLKRVAFDVICLWKARSSYDIVYMLGIGASFFCFIPRLWGKKVWINTDGIEWARSKWSSMEKFAAVIMEKFCMITPNIVIADAFAIKDYLQSRYKRIPACKVIPYGSYIIANPDVKILENWKLFPFRYYLVVCRLEPENHIIEIIRGYIKSDSTLPLVIVGNHQAEDSYVKKLLAISDCRIKFIGTLYDKDKLCSLRFYAKAYFHGHSVGGTNPSLLEALGCSNAIIAHDNPFNREVAGIAAEYFGSEDDIPKIVSKLNDENILCKMRNEAVNIVKNRYTWEKILNDYMDLLNNEQRVEL